VRQVHDSRWVVDRKARTSRIRAWQTIMADGDDDKISYWISEILASRKGHAFFGHLGFALQTIKGASKSVALNVPNSLMFFPSGSVRR